MRKDLVEGIGGHIWIESNQMGAHIVDFGHTNTT
jgi:hypothetical protein